MTINYATIPASLKLIAEVDDVVSALNQRCGEQTESHGIISHPFQMLTDGSSITVQCFGYPIWDSEEDEREWFGPEDNQVQETVLAYVTRESKQFLDAIKSIQL